MRRSVLPILVSPLGSALAVTAILLAVHLAAWRAGLLPRLPYEHSNVAMALADGRGFSDPFGVHSGPTAWVPPAVPLLLAGAIEASRVIPVPALHTIAAFNSLAAFLSLYLLLRWAVPHWAVRSKVALIAAFLGYGLLDPDYLLSASVLASAASAALVAGLALAWRQPGSAAAWAAVFFANAFLVVTHPGLALGGALVSLITGLVLFQSPRGRSSGLLRSASVASLAGLLVAATPWIARNRQVFHEWIPLKSNGPFELALSQNETDDGVLSESSVVAGHPSSNGRMLSAYLRLGEAGFLLPYREEALRILREEPARYTLFCLNRLFDAIWYARPTSDTEPVRAKLQSDEAARLVGRRLLLWYGGMPPAYRWRLDHRSAQAERASLAAAGVRDLEALMADWSLAQGRIESRLSSPAAVVSGFLWSGFPSLCLAAAWLASWRRPSRVVLAAALVYIVALVPNILITHDLRHQANYAALFALFVAGAFEFAGGAVCRVRPPASQPAQKSGADPFGGPRSTSQNLISGEAPRRGPSLP